MKTSQLANELNTRIFEIFGLQYFSPKNVLENGVPERLPYLRGIYMLLLMIAYFAFLSIYLFFERDDLDLNVTAKTILTYSIQHTMKIGMFFIIFVSLLQSFLTSNKIAQIFHNVKIISTIITEDFKVSQNYEKIKRKLNRHGLMVMLVFVLIEMTVIIITSKSFEEVLLQLCYLLVLFVLLLTIYKFIFYVQVINCQIQKLNELLEGIFHVERPRVIEDLSINTISVKVHKVTDEIFKNFVSSKKIYNILFENGSLLNESMGITMLLVLIILVIALTASGYQIFVILVGGTDRDKIVGEIFT